MRPQNGQKQADHLRSTQVTTAQHPQVHNRGPAKHHREELRWPEPGLESTRVRESEKSAEYWNDDRQADDPQLEIVVRLEERIERRKQDEESDREGDRGSCRTQRATEIIVLVCALYLGVGERTNAGEKACFRGDLFACGHRLSMRRRNDSPSVTHGITRSRTPAPAPARSALLCVPPGVSGRNLQ